MKTGTLAYPAKFKKEREGGYSVSFPDFPEGLTQGETRDDAFRMAIDCLQACMEYRLEAKQDIPGPSVAKRGEVEIPVSLEVAPKIALYQAMRDAKYSNVRLAGKLNISETVVRRMLDPRHKSKPEQYTRALMALGRAVQVSIVPLN